MKTIRFTAFSILFGLLVLVSACKKETKPTAAPQTGSKISVTGQDAGAGLKTSINGLSTVWIKDIDQVGVYSAEARTTSGGATAIVNTPFTAATSAASSSFSGTMYWGTANTSHTFYAYYPYSGSAGSDATIVPVSLASSQTQSSANSNAHIGALDFLVATPTTVTSPPDITGAVGSAVNLNYNHLFTVLEFQIKGSGPLTAVKLVGTSNPVAFSGGTIDLTQPTPETGAAYAITGQTGTTQAVVTLTTPATLNTSTATSVYMVINPGTQTGNCSIGLSSDGTTWAYISKAAPVGGFLRGNKYVVSVNAATASVSIGDSYQGGKVFYILQSGDLGYVSGEIHGLIAATEDQGTSAWITGGSTQTTINGKTFSTLGKGKANTDFMIAQTDYAGGAAGVCHAYSITVNSVTYNDWYLPSKDELTKLYLQRVAVGGFYTNYWSSTEDAFWSAWCQNFANGTQNAYSKINSGYVRAIRSF